MKREHRNIVNRLMKEHQVRVDAGTGNHRDSVEMAKAIASDIVKEDGLKLNRDFVHRYGNLLMLTDVFIKHKHLR